MNAIQGFASLLVVLGLFVFLFTEPIFFGVLLVIIGVVVFLLGSRGRQKRLPPPPQPLENRGVTGKGPASCSNCGAELKENAKFCSNCAAPVTVQQSVKVEKIGPRRGVSALRALLIFGWVILSAAISFFGWALVAPSVNVESSIEFFLLVPVPILVIFAVLQVIMYKSRLLSSDRWLGARAPNIADTDRQTLLEQCQRGVFDPRTGNLAAIARGVKAKESEQYPRRFGQKHPFVVLRFRSDLMNSKGDLDRQIPVVIECEDNKWVGELSEGDMFTLQGKLKPDGILYAERALNVTTNSTVGRK